MEEWQERRGMAWKEEGEGKEGARRERGWREGLGGEKGGR